MSLKMSRFQGPTTVPSNTAFMLSSVKWKRLLSLQARSCEEL